MQTKYPRYSEQQAETEAYRVAEWLETGELNLISTPKPFKKHCQFGHGHLWIFVDAKHKITQCSTCGCMSSNWLPES